MISQRLHEFLGHDEVKTKQLWKAIVGEFVATLFLVLIGCGACVTTTDVVAIALTFGLAIAVLVQCVCHVSGGHINPAVTLGMLATGQVPLIRALFYIIFQCVGAVAGAALLKYLSPVSNATDFGISALGKGITVGQGVGVELLITFVLVLTINAVCDSNRSDVKGSAPIAIGLAVATNHLFAIKYTGASMNPARSFGPALISNIWTNHWIYWIGPCIGGIASSVFYHFVLRASTPSNQDEESLILENKPSQQVAGV